MRSMFSVVSVLFVGLIGCRTGEAQMTSRSALASNPGSDDSRQICPDICGAGTLCFMPDGSCEEVCNSCYCTRDGGTVVGACPKQDSLVPRELRATGRDLVAACDSTR